MWCRHYTVYNNILISVFSRREILYINDKLKGLKPKFKQ